MRQEYAIAESSNIIGQLVEPRLALAARAQATGRLAVAGEAISIARTASTGAGRVARSVGPDGQATEYTYWPDGQVKTVTDALGNVTRYEYTTIADLFPAGTIEYGGGTTGDKFIIQMRDLSTGNLTAPVNVWATEDLATLLSALKTAIDIASGPFDDVVVTISGDDTFLHLEGAVNPNDNNERKPFALYLRTTEGNNSIVTDGQAFYSSPMTIVRDALGNETFTEYDRLGRLSRVTYPDGSFTETAYERTADGRIEHRTEQRKSGDPAVTTQYVYDLADGLEQVVMPDPDSGGPLGVTTWTYEYDADASNGNLAAIVDPRSGVTHSTYNPTGIEIQTTFAYDALGRRVSRTLPEGQVETWEYDDEGRLEVHVDFEDQGTRYVYFETGAHAGMVEKELRFASGVDPHGSGYAERTEYAYDDLHRQKQVTEYVGSNIVRTETYSYDAITGGVASRSIFGPGKVPGTDQPDQVINHAYQPATGRHTRTWTASTDTSYGYDELGRLKTTTVTKRNGTTLGTPDVTTYAYDAVGNLDSVTLAPATGLVTDYDYDALNRLVLETVKRGETMVAEYDYNASGMELASDGQREGVVEKHYDGSGDLFCTTTIDWTYDAWNRLVGEAYAYDEEGGSGNDYSFLAEYVYDPVGNRLSKSADWSDDDKDESITYYYGVRNGDASRGELDGNDRLLVEYGTVASSTAGMR